ncbi:hypothetical protein BDQ17DRAFT_1329420 [Cyathus striatus]|nr:hypothetical protein BDQ17DRAFT_1329420 [Cyathus striatus]
MPRNNKKTTRRLQSAHAVTTIAQDFTSLTPSLPVQAGTIFSTTSKIFEIALTVLRNKEEIMELAHSCNQVNKMVMECAVRSPQDSQLQVDIAELQVLLNNIQSMVQKFIRHRKFALILAANTDKKEINRTRKQLQHMLGVFGAAQAIEIQQGVVATQKNTLDIQHRTVGIQEGIIRSQQTADAIHRNVVKIVQTTIETNEKVNILMIRTLDSATAQHSDKEKECNIHAIFKLLLNMLIS